LPFFPQLQGRKAACFVTKQFKMKWMGSTRAVKQITRAAEQKGTSITASGIVQWSSDAREEQIRQVVDSMSRIKESGAGSRRQRIMKKGMKKNMKRIVIVLLILTECCAINDSLSFLSDTAR